MSRCAPLVLVVFVGCGGSLDPVPDGGSKSHQLGNGHLLNGCQLQSDCDDANPCTTDLCRLDNHVCVHKEMDCSTSSDTCNRGVCDVDSGTCVQMPANEAEYCDALDGRPGQCVSGSCMGEQSCTVSFWPLDCYHPLETALGGSNRIDKYACASGETGPEEGYPLRFDTDRKVSVLLTAQVDLDLIVLTGVTCNGAAACAASSVTPGSGYEFVTFDAKAGQDYTVVVESKAGGAGPFTLTVECAGCADAVPIGCNMTVKGNTTAPGTQQGINSYQCASSEGGPEDSYRFTPASDTNYKVTLTGMSSALDLLVVNDYAGMCDPSACRAFNTQAGTGDKSITFNAYAGGTYYAIVDSRSVGGSYQLEVECPPSCRSEVNSLGCGMPADTRRNDDPLRSHQVVDRWATDANTTGPEVVYSFEAVIAGVYTVDLTGLTADLDLIVLQQDYAGCDPTTTPVASSITAGSADESVTFTAEQAKHYWIAVDGKAGAVSPYRIKLHSPSCPAPSCYQPWNALGCNYLEDRRRNDDSARSTNQIDDWSCDANTTGPEVVYRLQPPAAGQYTVTLDGLSADLDLVVLSSASATDCNPSAASVASSTQAGLTPESLSFTGDPSLTYYIAVDGKRGAVGSYHIQLASPVCSPAVCSSGGLDLSCTLKNRSVSNQNDAAGATSDVTNWSCAAGESGPEFAHLFTPTGPGPYTVQLLGLSADLDLIVLEAGAGATCSPSTSCTAFATTAGTADEKLTFTADPAKQYWLIVDGKGGAISSYTLAVIAGCP